ncbi:hypothetical protein, partial [Brachybacterium alimentarium]|uniref:hypothetical protein n=1 Tax=Brachybacterium alimentarium TaxID=47845 RepID=UPI003FCFCD89
RLFTPRQPLKLKGIDFFLSTRLGVTRVVFDFEESRMCFAVPVPRAGLPAFPFSRLAGHKEEHYADPEGPSSQNGLSGG